MPPVTVYRTEFSTRLRSTWAIRIGSATTVSGDSGTVTSKVSPLALADSENSAQTSSTSSRKSKVSVWAALGSSAPSARVNKSRSWAWRAETAWRIRRIAATLSGRVSLAARSSADATMFCSGERTSWLTMLRNLRLAEMAFSIAVTAIRRSREAAR